MFPLNDLSILFTALMIIAFAFLGIFVLFGMLISLRRKDFLQTSRCATAKTDHKHESEEPSNEEVTIGDWVTYLSSEKFGMTGTIMNIAAILVAMVALIYSVGTKSLLSSIVDGIVVIALTTWILIKVFNPSGRRAKSAGEVLKAIMEGSLATPRDIRKVWIEKIAGDKGQTNKKGTGYPGT